MPYTQHVHHNLIVADVSARQVRLYDGLHYLNLFNWLPVRELALWRRVDGSRHRLTELAGRRRHGRVAELHSIDGFCVAGRAMDHLRD